MTLRRIILYTVIVLSILLLILLLIEFHQALIIFIFSLAVAAAFRPLVDRFSQQGMARNLALILVYLLALAVFAGILLLIGNSLLNELQQMTDNLARSYDQIWREWPQGTEFQQLIVQQLPAPAELYESFSVEQRNSALQALLGVTLSWFNFLGQISAILVLSVYWSIDRVHFERLWLSLLPVESRARYRDIWRDIEHDFGLYMRSEVFQSVMAGVLLGIGYQLMGMPYPTLLALFAALAWLIPWLGGVLAVLPVALTGLSVSLGLGIGGALYSIAVLFFLEFVIEPRFTHRRQFSTLLNILLILILVEPFGLLGFILAPPLAAAIGLIFRYSLQTRSVPPSAESIQRFTELQTRLQAVRQMVEHKEEPLEPQTTSMLDRLETLIHRTGEILK